MVDIHPTAVVDATATIADGVTIGPFSIVGPNVSIGRDTVIESHCVISGHTQIGAGNRFYPYCAIGCDPQDKKYANEPTQLVIGDRNTFFHNVTVSTGTAQDNGITTVGNDNWVMAYAHIAHDCIVGNNVILANGATLAGHVNVGDFAILGGLTAVHQFCVIGQHTMAGGGSIIVQDLPPFVICEGNRAVARGFNSEGMKRRDFKEAEIKAVKSAYRMLYRSGLPYEDVVAQISEQAQQMPVLNSFVEFFELSSRGILR
ncbi:acyl-ACP--UDP-N-acetylglucosamine O-acyltransferase [Chitinibacter fontanus]|uniref:Acyl-[acyl-carrier-protein]--UDP-N-acetylglucosamine O-acyltransferase n=1 Tax=Chitinibacter fontanus TaxID=1737446 RepID=A0A7D5YZR5_9NEIS|nr:acyl-ACP--UDP-N-acetylglucosamine O-acyltransferase [Chitinibacter fontanus]QLI80081.1 acyl-ACP--UDP-N-acetylglucosamine O-acyltransferase [Chitinibacter fontanus]